ncbi:MAG: DMT family transporter [Betaproteobacteria bacterium]|nr:DMT family transporter [Betaproteobacteria bacterium]
MALTLALLSTLCFGAALITAALGLRSLDARSGAAISIPSATLLFVVAMPFMLDLGGFSWDAALIFAVVGLFFPALVTLVTFRANDQLGPSVTGAISSTAPLFALLAAAVLLQEDVPPRAIVAACGVAAGVAMLSWRRARVGTGASGWALLLPVWGAALRGLAQVMAKAGLLIWPNPFAASLIGYLVSSATVLTVDRVPRAARLARTRAAVAWFALTGLINGAAVLLMYSALTRAPVSTVAPVVATYPLVTVLLSAIFLRAEPLPARAIAGILLSVAAILYLVAG